MFDWTGMVLTNFRCRTGALQARKQWSICSNPLCLQIITSTRIRLPSSLCIGFLVTMPSLSPTLSRTLHVAPKSAMQWGFGEREKLLAQGYVYPDKSILEHDNTSLVQFLTFILLR